MSEPAALMTVSEAVKFTGLDRRTIYELLNREEPLPHVKVGRSYRIVRDKAMDYIEAAYQL